MFRSCLYLCLALFASAAISLSCGTAEDPCLDDSCGAGATGGGGGSAGNVGAAGTGGSGGAAGAGGNGAAGGGGSGGTPVVPTCGDTVSLREDALQNGAQLLNGVNLDVSTSISQLNNNPQTYDMQHIRIEGPVSAVCSSAGCWANLVDAMGNGMVLKVTDGFIDFRNYVLPGNYMVGEGIFYIQGEHGPEVYIQDHGAVVGTIVCP